MQAIILAGGFGTRLAPLTYSRAKSLLPILNEPMIQYLIDSLPSKTEIIVAANYRIDQIEKYFEQKGREIIINEEPKPLGTGGAVKYAQKYIDDTFLVLNADIISSLKIDELIKFHIEKGATATISLWPVKNVEEFGVVDITEDKRIKKFIEKPRKEEAPSNLINAGAYCLETDVFDYIEPGRLVSMEQEIFPAIIDDGKPFYGYQFGGFWIDVGRISSYIKANVTLLEKRGVNSFIGENCKIDGSIERACMGNNVVVERKAIVNLSVVYDDAVIHENAIIRNCVIGENCEIGREANLDMVVIGDNEKIPSGKKLRNEAIWNKPMPSNYPDRQIGNVLRE